MKNDSSTGSSLGSDPPALGSDPEHAARTRASAADPAAIDPEIRRPKRIAIFTSIKVMPQEWNQIMKTVH
jgi:hypothetical protein